MRNYLYITKKPPERSGGFYYLLVVTVISVMTAHVSCTVMIVMTIVYIWA